MTMAAVITGALALAAILGAIIYQKKDSVAEYGSTMGGQMVTANLWHLAALLAGAAAGLQTRWYWGIAAGIGIVIAGTFVRNALEPHASQNKPEDK